ncbi:hypothetical protein BDZ45DRAFT_181447 [Acephala macrosclerotiorum]|nr:hypothetical protein BDZ45DRAFT_181447 [Acephala macrosclerotiorum]
MGPFRSFSGYTLISPAAAARKCELPRGSPESTIGAMVRSRVHDGQNLCLFGICCSGECRTRALSQIKVERTSRQRSEALIFVILWRRYLERAHGRSPMRWNGKVTAQFQASDVDSDYGTEAICPCCCARFI